MEWKPLLKFFIFTSVTLFSISCFAGHNELRSQKRPYALTISGGISLGVYEAGLNWVIVEQLRNGRLKGDKNARLQAITGASAGAINTLIAALRYCEKETIPSFVEDNLFNETWRYIGIEGLLPDNAQDYDAVPGYKDGILSRKVFKRVLNLLKERAIAQDYRNNCKLSVGLTVTRSVPEAKVIGAGDGKQHIKVQRFVIPLIVETVNNYIVFRNNINYPQRNKELGYLFLKQDKNGYIDFDDVIKSALASSAFPFAFGRVKMPYCRPVTLNGTGVISADKAEMVSENYANVQESCPRNYEQVTYDFVDGGFFDNVPLGLAIELTECRIYKHKNCIQEVVSKEDILNDEIVNYIYMDPSKRRNIEIENDHAEEPLTNGYGLYNQGKFWIKAQEIYANAELYRTLKEKFDNSNESIKHQRRLLLTDRNPPLAGAYLGHFGAFFGQVFRNFDYYVGIYDGLVNFANLCINQVKQHKNHPHHNSKNQCYQLGAVPLQDKSNPHFQQSRKIGTVINLLTAKLLAEDDTRARTMIRILAEDEFVTYKTPGSRYTEWAWLDQLPEYTGNQASSETRFYYDLFTVMKNDDKVDFTHLLSEMRPIKNKYPDAFKAKVGSGSNKMLLRMIDEPDIWQFGLGRQILSRLHYLEQADKEKRVDLMLPIKLGRMVVNSFDEDNKIWSISSTNPSGFEYLIPDEIAFDGSQTGLVITYRNALTRIGDSRAYLESEISPLHWLRDRNDRANFASVGLNLRYAFKSAVFSSMGIGLRAYKNYSNDKNLDNDVIPGVSIGFGMLADKYRVSFEYKDINDGFDDEKYIIKFGINDFKGFVELFTSE